MARNPKFCELRFGRRDAHDEAVNEPQLLLEGFYDHRSAAARIEDTSAYLLLGPKGAGKSAVLEHLRLAWKERFDHFFTLWDLRGFPVADVRNVKTGETPGLTRTQNSWELLILLKLIDSLHTDAAVLEEHDYRALHDALVEAGMLAGEWNSRVVRWSRSTVKVNLSIFEIGADLERRNSLNLLQIVEVLRRAIKQLRLKNRHMLAIDGLDSLYIDSANQWQSLAGLVQAIEALNRYFRECSHPLQIVAALRSDIFNILPTSESNKYKEYGVELDWALEGAAHASPLWVMALRKAQVAEPSLSGLIETYLSRRAPIGRGGADPAEFILEYTRMLPRDLIEVLKAIQGEHLGDGPVPGDKLVRATEVYCREYFEGEIFNNLQGVLTGTDAPRKVAAFRDALRTVPSRLFAFGDVSSELEGSLSTGEVAELLRQMFEVGGVGIRTGSHTDFLYRRPGGAGFTRRHGFVLHNALARAWNRPWGGPS